MIALALTLAALASGSKHAARAILLVLFGACAPEVSGETVQVHVGQGDLAAPREPESELLEQPDAPARELLGGELEPEGAALEQLEPISILTLDAPHCAGQWADRSDATTRYVAHPDTGLCTIPCRWQEPKCAQSWYTDPRCQAAHDVRLAAVCAELGGSCAPASDGVSYCEVLP